MLGHRLDACASCVEHGTPWVTEASSFAVFSFFSSLWHYDTQVYISGFRGHMSSFLTDLMDRWMMSWLYGLCADSIDCCLFLSSVDYSGNCFVVGTLELLRIV